MSCCYRTIIKDIVTVATTTVITFQCLCFLYNSHRVLLFPPKEQVVFLSVCSCIHLSYSMLQQLTLKTAVPSPASLSSLSAEVKTQTVIFRGKCNIPRSLMFFFPFSLPLQGSCSTMRLGSGLIVGLFLIFSSPAAGTYGNEDLLKLSD